MLKVKNIVFSILLQAITKTSNAIETIDENSIVNVIKDVFAFVNNYIENYEIRKDISPEDAENEIQMLDKLYTMYSTLFKIIITQIDKSEVEKLRPEYNRLIDNFEDFRDSLELFTDVESMQLLKEISEGDYSNFINLN